MVTPFSYLFTMAITVNLFKSVQIHLFKASAFRTRLALGEAVGTQKTQTNKQKNTIPEQTFTLCIHSFYK